MVSHASTPRRRGLSAPQFWGFLFILAYTLCRRTTKFDMVTQTGEGACFCGVSHTPTSRGGVPALHNFGVPSFYAYPLLSQNCQIWRSNTSRGWACILESAAPFMSREWSSCGPKFLEVLLYLCQHALTQNDRIRHGNTYISRMSATPLYLHKCVARFVGDSWVSCLGYIARWRAYSYGQYVNV